MTHELTHTVESMFHSVPLTDDLCVRHTQST